MAVDLLTAQTIPAYLADHPLLATVIDAGSLSSIVEVGDGNLNLVFIVRDTHGRGIVLKQALPYVRMVGPEWPLSPERARHEAHALSTHAQLAPHLVPRLFGFDSDRYIIAMEDLSDHGVWRSALNEGQCQEGIAPRMGEYVAAIAFGTSTLSLDPRDVQASAAACINPEMCAITEDLVFTEPVADIGRNSVLPANEGDARALASDPTMVRAMGHAKWLFTTSGEALIHGDLHTGSVMARGAGVGRAVDSAKAFDSEFSFYGPVAFDLGSLWAHYTLAAARAVALGEDERADWCLALCGQTWTSFETTLRAAWPNRRDARLFTDGFADDLLARWHRETWLFAAAEMSRRIVGLAKASDIETLPAGIREGAARGTIRVALSAVRREPAYGDAAAFAAMAAEILLENRTG